MIDLRCGDCLSVLKTLPENSIDVIFTDPPYGHQNNDNGDLIQRWELALKRTRGVGSDPRPIANDGPKANELFRAALPELRRVLKPNCCCCCCCCGGGGPDPQFARWALWMGEVFTFKQMVIWDKGKMGMGWHYRRSYETVLVGQKGKGKCAWYDDSHRIENVIRPGDYGIKKIIPRADQHPTEKPIALAAHFIRLHAPPGATVLDPFMGTGSTGVAAIQGGYNFIGIELDKSFYCRALQRIKEAQR